MKQIKLSIKKVVKGCALILLSQALISCGTNEESEEQVQQQKPEQVELDVSQSNVTIGAPVKKVAGQTIGNNQVVQAGLLNSTGSIEYPEANTQFSGNITTSVQVADPDGINRVFVTFAETDFQLTICSENCGNEFAAFVNGINPLQFGLSSGQQTFEVWVEDNLNNIDLVDSVAINWQSLVISGVSIEFLQEEQQINVSWQPLDGMLRYNLYIANDPSLNGKNVETLAGGEARLALTETSANFTEKAFAEDYFILVTGVDGSGESAFSDVISLLNGEQNLPPVANNDSFTVNEDEQLEANVLANDEARDSVISLVTTPVRNVTNGSLVLAANGDFQYQPNENFFGTDEFVYQIQNAGSLTAEATVSITINSINDAPVAQDDAYAFDLSLGSFSQEAPGVLGNDSDIDSDTLTVSSELVESPTLGVVTLNGDGSFNYVANDASIELLEDSFVYQILDSEGLTANATVSIRGELDVNHPPVAVNDEFSVNEDEMLTVTFDESILNNDSDEDHDNAELTVSLVSSTTNGELVLASDGSFDYSPTPNFNGQDSFTYQISDPDQQSATAIVTINVTPINDAPTAVDNTYILTVDNTFTISNEKGVLNNDGDVENDEIKVDVTTLTFPSGTLEMSELGGFTYTPPNGFIGTDSFTYKVTDGNLLSAEATVQFSVTDRQYITDNQTSIIIANSSNDPVQVVFTADMISAEHGSFEISDDGLIVTYIPNPDFVGMDLITIEVVVDGVTTSVQYYIYVEAVVNLPPEFSSSNSASVAENVSSGSLIYTAVAVDPEGGLVTYALTGQANAAGVPNSELQVAAVEVELPFEIDAQTGQLSLSQGSQLDFETTPSYSLSIVASDNAGNQSTLALSLSVININEAPIATDDSVIVPRYIATVIDVLANDTDPENDSLSIVASSLNANSGAVAVLSDQTLSYLPNDDATVDVISYQVQDAGGLQSQATVAVTIADAPATGPHDINADGVNDLTIVKSDDLQEWQLTFDSSVSLVSEVDANRLYPLEKSVSGIFEPKVAFSEQTKSYEVVISGKKHQIDLMDLASDAVINLERSGTLLAKDFSGITLPASFIYIEPGYNTDNFSKFNRASVNAGSNAGATLTFNADNTGVYTDDEGRQTFNWSIDGSVITAVKDSPISETVTITPDELLALGVIDSATHTNYLNNYGYGDDLLEIPVEEPSITLEITDNVNVYLQLNEVTRLLYQLPAELGGTQSQIDSEAVAVRAYQLELLSLVDFDPLANNGQWALPISDITGEFDSPLLASGAQFESATTGYFYDFLDSANTTAFTWSITDQALTIETIDFTHVYEFFGHYSNAWYALLNVYDKNNDKHYSATSFVTARLSEDLTPVTELMTSGVIVNLITTTDPSNYDSNGNFAIDNLFAHELTMTAEPRAESGINKSYQYYSSGGETYLIDNYWKLDVNHFLINSYINSADGSSEVCDESADTNCVVLQQRDLEVLNFDSERGLVWVIESRQRLNYASTPFDPESTPLTTLVKPRITAYSVLPSQDLVSDAATIDEDSNALTIDVLANDYTNIGLVDGLTILGATADYGSVSVVNGELVYTPEFNFNGIVTIQYLVFGPNGELSSEQVTLTISAVNDAPTASDFSVSVAEGGNVSINLLHSDIISDVDSASLDIDVSTLPTNTTNGSIVNNGDGTVTYNHDGSETTSDSFTYQVTDGELNSNSITVSIAVTAVNDAPILDSLTTLTLNENEQSTGVIYTATSTDAENDAVTYTLTDSNNIFNMSTNGDMVISDHSQLDFESFTPYDLTIVASDGTDSSSQYFVTVTLTDVVESIELVESQAFADAGLLSFNTYAETYSEDYLVDTALSDSGDMYVLVDSMSHASSVNTHVVMKVKSTGGIDTSFAYQGKKQLRFNNLNDPNVASFTDVDNILSITPTYIKVDNHPTSPSYEKIYVYGYQNYQLAADTFAYDVGFVIRLNKDGSLDTSFGTDGKVEFDYVARDGSNTQISIDHTEVSDVLIDEASGDLYVAMHSGSNTVGDNLLVSQLTSKVVQLDTAGATLNSVHFVFGGSDLDDNSSFGELYVQDGVVYDEFVKGLTYNNNGDLVAFGHVQTGNNYQLLIAQLRADLSMAFNDPINFIDLQNGDDLIDDFYLLSATELLVAGRSIDAVNNGEQDGFIGKLNLDTASVEYLALDTSFAGEVGYLTIDDFVGDYEGVSSIAVDASGDISFINKHNVGNAGNYSLIAGQFGPDGINTTLEHDELALIDLTQNGASLAESKVHGEVIINQNDVNEVNHMFGVSRINNVDTNNDEYMVTSIRFDYIDNATPVDSVLWYFEGQPINSLLTTGLTQLTSGNVLVGSQIVNYKAPTESYEEGFSLSMVDKDAGNLLSTTGSQSTIVDKHTPLGSSIIYSHIDTVPLSNGSYIIVYEKSDSGTRTLELEQYTDAGSYKSDSGFPVSIPLDANNIYSASVAYNETSDRLLVAARGAGASQLDSYVLGVRLSDGAPLFLEADNVTPTYIKSFDAFGTDSFDELLALVVRDDGSFTGLGVGVYDQRSFEDGFMMQFDASGNEDVNFDGDAGDGVHALRVPFLPNDNLPSLAKYLVELSDGSFVALALEEELQQNYVMKVEETSVGSGQFIVDVNFDSDEGDAILQLNLDSNVNSIDQTTTAKVQSLLVDSNDKVYAIGDVNISGLMSTGFIARIDTQLGSLDSSFASNTTKSSHWKEGVAIPANIITNNDWVCSDTNNQADIFDICDVTSFQNGYFAADGSLYISGLMSGPTVQSSVSNGINSVLLNYDLLQDDRAPEDNNSPVFTSTTSFNVSIFDATGYVVYTAQASDSDGDSLTYELVSDPMGFFQMDQQTGELSIIDANQLSVMTYTITVSVSDGLSTVTQDITVNIVNPA